MESNMNLRATILLGFAGFIAQPAFAQTAAPTASPAPTSMQATFDSLLASGYEIKAVAVMSDATTKEVYPSQTNLPSQVFVTLQKGTSLAVCELASVDLLSMTGSVMADATRCFKH
jgi:hypothetical protein